MMNNKEIDIITDKALVECKNVYWDFYIKNVPEPPRFEKIEEQIKNLEILSQKIQKPALLCTRFEILDSMTLKSFLETTSVKVRIVAPYE